MREARVWGRRGGAGLQPALCRLWVESQTALRRESHSYYTRQMKLPRLLQPLSARAVCGSKQAGGARRWRGEGITHREALP